MTTKAASQGAMHVHKRLRWAAVAIILSMFAILCSAVFFLGLIPWENSGTNSSDALTWDGLTAMVSTLISAFIAGGVAAWVLTVQNRKQAELQRKAAEHQVELQREANKAQQEEARKAREIEAASNLAEHIDTKWSLFRNGMEVDAHLGDTSVPVKEINHLRRLTNIWTAQLRDELIEQAGLYRGDIRDAVLKFAEAMEWAEIHHDHQPITSKDASGNPHTPWASMWNGQMDLMKVAHYITDMPTVPDSYSSDWLQMFVRHGKSYGQFMYHVPRYQHPLI